MEFGGRFTWNDEQTSRCQAVDFPILALENTEKKTSYFPLYWLVNRDPYNGLL